MVIDSMAAPDEPQERETYGGLVAPLASSRDGIPESLAENGTQYLFGKTTHEENADLIEEGSIAGEPTPAMRSTTNCTRGSIDRTSPMQSWN